MKKLDRVLVNDAWLHVFPQSYSSFEAGGCSDHLRCRVILTGDEGNRIRRHKPFKFVNVFTELKEFKPVVETYWKDTEPLFLSTSTLYLFTKKLKGLKPKIRLVARECIGDLVKKNKRSF